MVGLDEEASTYLTKILIKAEELTEVVRDPQLRKIAFEQVIRHLLGEHEPPLRRSKPRIQSQERLAPQPSKPGPKAWIKDLIDESFFSEPRSTKQILQALAERGRVLETKDITWQLSQLVKDKVFRRKKRTEEADKRPVWFYSRW